MADEAASNEPLANGADTQPTIGLILQYVKDLSFENPNSPAVYQWQDQPEIDVQFNIASDKPGEDVFEVVLKVEVKAKTAQGTAFAADLTYGGLFAVRNVSDEQIHPFLFAEAPRLLFPFARQILAEATRNGGFPPLMIDPIDFAQMFSQRMAEEQARARVQTN